MAITLIFFSLEAKCGLHSFVNAVPQGTTYKYQLLPPTCDLWLTAFSASKTALKLRLEPAEVEWDIQQTKEARIHWTAEQYLIWTSTESMI